MATKVLLVSGVAGILIALLYSRYSGGDSQSHAGGVGGSAGISMASSRTEKRNVQIRYNLDDNARTHGDSDADAASSLIRRIKEVYSGPLDAQEKRNQCGVLVRQLAPLVGTCQTVRILNDVIGPGLDKSVLVAQAFEWAKENPDQSILSLQQLEGVDFKQGYSGLMSRLLKDGDFSSIRDMLKAESMAQPGEAMWASLGVFLGNIENDDRASQIYRSASSIVIDLPPKVQETYLTALANAGMRRCVFEVWTNLNALGTQPGISADLVKAIETAKDKAIGAMVFENPELAMEQLKRGKGSAPKSFMVAIQTWLKSSKVACSNWYEQNRNQLTTEQRSNAEYGFAEFEANQGSYEVARGWIGKIECPAIKRDIEGKVWTAERDSLRNEVRKNPTETIQGMVSGQSKYADYWIEEAMGTWISKDFDKAQSWYQENWNKLPANKSQFLAAAFANQAASQGDATTARQWAAYIQDPKTKQRIEAGIAKAEAAKQN